MRPELHEFAKALVEHVRDRTIRSADGDLRPEAAGPVAERWRAAGVQRVDVVIPDVVDETIFSFLNAIDRGLLQLAFVSKDGTTVNLSEEGLGELGGWFMASDGWRTTHSKERFVDDFADMKE